MQKGTELFRTARFQLAYLFHRVRGCVSSNYFDYHSWIEETMHHLFSWPASVVLFTRLSTPNRNPGCIRTGNTRENGFPLIEIPVSWICDTAQMRTVPLGRFSDALTQGVQLDFRKANAIGSARTWEWPLLTRVGLTTTSAFEPIIF